MADNGQEYITVEEVAAILKVGIRQATRYADRIRTRKAGRRLLYHRGDVEAVAQQLGAEHKAAVPPPAELVPLGTMMQTFERQQQRIEQLAVEVGRLQGLLEAHQRQLSDAEAVRRRVWELELERERLLAELEQLRHRDI